MITKKKFLTQTSSDLNGIRLKEKIPQYIEEQENKVIRTIKYHLTDSVFFLDTIEMQKPLYIILNETYYSPFTGRILAEVCLSSIIGSVRVSYHQSDCGIDSITLWQNPEFCLRLAFCELYALYFTYFAPHFDPHNEIELPLNFSTLLSTLSSMKSRLKYLVDLAKKGKRPYD